MERESDVWITAFLVDIDDEIQTAESHVLILSFDTIFPTVHVIGENIWCVDL